MRVARLSALVAAFVLAGVVVANTSADPTLRSCGRFSVKLSGRTYTYAVRVAVGRLSCASARTVLRSFIVTGRSPRGWFCVRGHASQGQKWAAGCTRAGADIRAYPVR
jgi:hypothetical protein